jgi:AcrR family transcriptional regulator
MVDTMRADGRRSRESLLEAACGAFAEHGTEVSLREVARRAGVGIGTLYRHFPTRDALIEACMSHGLDALCTHADDLLASESAGNALDAWLLAFVRGSTRYQGLPASLLAALYDPASQLHRSCQAMRTAATRLMTRAQQAGQVRGDLTVDELLALAAGIAWAGHQAPGSAELTSRLFDLIRTGIDLPAPA